MERTYYYINNQFIESTKAMIPFNDAGFLYGDGLFETMRFDNRKIFSIHKLEIVFFSIRCWRLFYKRNSMGC